MMNRTCHQNMKYKNMDFLKENRPLDYFVADNINHIGVAAWSHIDLAIQYVDIMSIKG